MSKCLSSFGIAGFFWFSEWHSHSESKLGMNAGFSVLLYTWWACRYIQNGILQ